MKTVGLVVLLLITFVACKKETINYPYCWHCEVADTQRQVDTCTQQKDVPVFFDFNGNEQQAICTMKE